ncbi:MAG: DUF4397 domain-containing protein [Gemmatimonadetes bacterium]|nr:DUF4397 domain-containing protein [Gemmatimonadota bacterium]
MLLLAASVACGSTDPSGGLPPGDAQLAILNALPEGTVATLLLDDAALSVPASGTRISRVVPAGTHRLEARAEGGRILSSAQFAVSVGGRRTAILGGAVIGGGAVVIAADTASLPRATEVKVRVINTVQGTPALDAWLSVAGVPLDSAARLVSPLEYGATAGGEFPGFVIRPPGTYRLGITAQATGMVEVERVVSLGGGEVWSLILVRRSSGELEVVPIREA